MDLNKLNLVQKMADDFVDELGNDLKKAFTRIAKKENVAEHEIQLAIRHKYPGDIHEYMDKVFISYAKKMGVEEGDVQLAVRFSDLPDGQAELYFEVLRDWEPYIMDKFLGSKTDCLQDYVIRELPKLNEVYKVVKWSTVSIIFYKDEADGATKMGVFIMQDGEMELRESFPFAPITFRHPDNIYYELLVNWKFQRRASFPKDFLGHGSIMPDLKGKEKMVKLYITGAIVMGKQIPSQFDRVCEKYKTTWDNASIIFFKDEGKDPEVSVCVVDGENYDRKETLPLFKKPEVLMDVVKEANKDVKALSAAWKGIEDMRNHYQPFFNRVSEQCKDFDMFLHICAADLKHDFIGLAMAKNGRDAEVSIEKYSLDNTEVSVNGVQH